MSLTTPAFSLARSSLFALVALVFLAGAPARATWTFLQVVSFPTDPTVGCPFPSSQCTLDFTNQSATTAGSTLALGFGLHGFASQVQIISAYTCASNTPCDPANGNVIDTFTIPMDTLRTHACADFIDGHSVDCAYVVSGAGGAKYVTINISGYPETNRWFPSMTEAKSSTGTQSFNAAGAAKSSAKNQTQSGVSLTLTGTNDFIFQIIDAGPGQSQITPFITCFGQTYTELLGGDHYASAYALNTSCGAAPTWAWTGQIDTGVVGAVAFKE